MPGKDNLKDYDDPGKILAAIIANRGESILENPLRFLAEFNDYRKDNFTLEYNIIKLSFSENIPSDLRSKKNKVPFSILGRLLVKKIHDSHGTQIELAEWVVYSWAFALGIISKIDSPKKTSEKKSIKTFTTDMSSDTPAIGRNTCPLCGCFFTGEPVFCENCGMRLPNDSSQQNTTKVTSQRMGITTLPDAMFRANPQHTSEYDNDGSVPTKAELWRFGTKGPVRSSPAVSNGIVYVGSRDKNLYAIDAMTGKKKWRFGTKGSVRSSPAVSNGIVYVGSYDDNLYAIDAVTGKEKWRFATGGFVSSSPVVANGVVYFGSADKNLYAIDAVTGKEKWRFATGGSVFPPPAVSNDVVYVGSYFGSADKNLYAIDAVTGKEKWRFATGGSVFSSPAVSNGVVYFGSDDKNLYAIDAVTGKEKWRFATGEFVRSSPAVSNGVVYVGSDNNNLYAIGKPK